MFFSGQKVQCVSAASRNGVPAAPLVEGRVYTVAEFRPAGAPGFYMPNSILPVAGVLLVGVRSGNGWSFKADRFRPLAEPKTDISIFREALVGDLVS